MEEGRCCHRERAYGGANESASMDPKTKAGQVSQVKSIGMYH